MHHTICKFSRRPQTPKLQMYICVTKNYKKDHASIHSNHTGLVVSGMMGFEETFLPAAFIELC